jgi:spore maturation protein CgeB
MNIAFFRFESCFGLLERRGDLLSRHHRALNERGHQVTFYEPDAYERQQHRDIDDPDWARVVVYENDADAARRVLEAARGADLVVKASGVGVFDELLEAGVLELQSFETLVAFWDVDAPATLDRVENNLDDAFRPLISRYDMVLTYGGGDPVINAYTALGARECVPVYNALDPSTHHPVAPDPNFAADLGFLGNACRPRGARRRVLLGCSSGLARKEVSAGR